MRFKCLRCGRDNFKLKGQDHWCNGNFRKHYIPWQMLNDDGTERETVREAMDRFLLKRGLQTHGITTA